MSPLMKAILEVLAADRGGATPRDIAKRLPGPLCRYGASSVHGAMGHMRSRHDRHWVYADEPERGLHALWKISNNGLNALREVSL